MFSAGLVDECHLLICPLFLGAGKPSLPRDMRAHLELLDERRFGNGVVYVRYRSRPDNLGAVVVRSSGTWRAGYALQSENRRGTARFKVESPMREPSWA